MSATTPLHELSPFRSRLDQSEAQVEVSGSLPGWLRGTLVRTAPALFEHRGFQAEHWFDALGMLYAFQLRGPKDVRFRQRALESDSYREPLGRASFGTRNRRSIVRRVLEPIPKMTDNANVNVMKLGDDWVAMTETSTQWRIAPDTLAAIGKVQWDDRHRGLPTLAHPHLSHDGNVVTIGNVLVGRAGLRVLEHRPGDHTRREVGMWYTGRVPYVHTFGLSERFVALIHHPFDVNPITMLWSNRGYVDHFAWRPKAGTRIGLMSRRDGTTRVVEAPPMFVFHIINTFEHGDDVILDVVAYEDASIAKGLAVDTLRDSFALTGKMKRIELRAGQQTAVVSTLSDTPFEFPSINYRRCNGKAYTQTWGARIWAENETPHSSVVHVKTNGVAQERELPGSVIGEPLFVPRPGGSAEDDGVLLAVGSGADGEHSTLFVLAAASLDTIATARIDIPLPLGFHGCFSGHTFASA